MIQLSVDQLLDQITLADLVGSEHASAQLLHALMAQHTKVLS
jgi:hypothetical protein